MFLSKEEKVAVFTLAVKLYLGSEEFEDACKKALEFWKVFNETVDPTPEVKPKTNK